MGSSSPNEDVGPLNWEHRVLAAGLQGSPPLSFKKQSTLFSAVSQPAISPFLSSDQQETSPESLSWLLLILLVPLTQRNCRVPRASVLDRSRAQSPRALSPAAHRWRSPLFIEHIFSSQGLSPIWFPSFLSMTALLWFLCCSSCFLQTLSVESFGALSLGLWSSPLSLHSLPRKHHLPPRFKTSLSPMLSFLSLSQAKYSSNIHTCISSCLPCVSIQVSNSLSEA